MCFNMYALLLPPKSYYSLGDSTHGLIPRWARLILLILLMFFEFLIRALMPSYESTIAMHIGGFILGILFSVVIIRNISNTHFERTYLVPAATWTLSAYIIFAIGWYVAISERKLHNIHLRNKKCYKCDANPLYVSLMKYQKVCGCIAANLCASVF